MMMTAPLFRLMAVSILALALSGCGGGAKRDKDGKMIPAIGDIDPSSSLYADVIRKANDGKCTENDVKILTCFSYRGRGYEGAQSALGSCLLTTDSSSGIEWLRRAADAGWADAQKHLARAYADGTGTSQDKIAAAKWNYLYTRNASLLSLGVQPDMTLSTKLRNELSSEQLALARRQAEDWTPNFWQPTEELTKEQTQACKVRPRLRPNVKMDYDPQYQGTPQESDVPQ
jgi:TPR repeat protein